MKARYAGIYALGLLTALMPIAHAQAAAVRKAVEAEYERANLAMKKRDVKAVQSMLTADCTWKTAAGQTMTRKDVDQTLAQQMQTLRKVYVVTTRIDKFALKGKEAVAVVTQKMEADAVTPDGKTHRLGLTSSSRDFWVNTGGKWKVHRTEEISSSTTVDGKPAGAGG